jgi:hypothetical protein
LTHTNPTTKAKQFVTKFKCPESAISGGGFGGEDSLAIQKLMCQTDFVGGNVSKNRSGKGILMQLS